MGRGGPLKRTIQLNNKEDMRGRREEMPHTRLDSVLVGPSRTRLALVCALVKQ